jgi:predicted NUDIX family phosphoesterase
LSDELVLVVPRAALLDQSGWHGIHAADPDAFAATVARHGRFAPRPAMERDPSFKQIIPYLVLRDGARYFLMRRTRAGADERLHDRFSIGVGGHLNPGDGDIDGGLRREWAEELDAGFVPDFRFVGLLNDDTTEVGSVHLGAVFIADAGGRPVSVREVDKLSGGFAEPADVAAVVDRMETWSSLVFAFFDRRDAASAGGAQADGPAVR